MPLVVSHLTCIYGAGLPTEAEALHDISFTAERGRIISIAGPTGSGKSTLAKHLNGLIIPQSGSVTVDGDAVVKDAAALRRIRSSVGLVFQYPEQQIFAETVAEEIAFGPSNWGVEGDELAMRVKNAMDETGLGEDLKERSPFMLSGGQKRRVAIASVLSSRPSYLVLDEPTAGLDCFGEKGLIAMIKEKAAKGCGIIHITHDIALALSISDMILVLDGGHEMSFGTSFETAEKLCSGAINCLEMPEVLRLSNMLRKSGRISRAAWDADDLLNLLKGGM